MTTKKGIDKAHNKDGYDKWSKSYDSDPNSTVFADETAFPKFWSHLKNKSVLEIGCGTGRHTEKLAALGNTITAIDLSSGMLAQARRKPSLRNVAFVESDVFQFSVNDGHEFDAVVAALVLEHIDDLKVFFKKVSGFLKPGGEAFFSEIHPSRMQAGSGARFRRDDNQEIWLDSLPHLEEHFLDAIKASGLVLKTKCEIMATNELVTHLPEWKKYEGRPMLQIWHIERLN